MTKARRAWLDANKDRMSTYGKTYLIQRQAALQATVTRFCFCCSTEKPSEAFWPTSKTRCRECAKAKAAPNVARKRAYVRQWQKENPERVKQWFSNNRIRRNRQWREMYAKDSDLRTRRAAYCATWVKQNMHLVRANSARRDAAELKATPTWADLDLIKAIYREAARLTIDTGISHEVDHIVPLRSRVVCGLHCAHNLQVITAIENRRKSNHLTHTTQPRLLSPEDCRQST